jgi:mannosyl-oligosaccharide alpha-1,2-mannosidase
MEFTRLAQLTKEAKYYDAVARITNAFEEWQNRGTTGLAGVFPTDVDASGCNRSAPVVNHSLPSGTLTPVDPLSADGEGYKAPTPKNVAEPKPVKGKGAKEVADIELSISPGQPDRAHLERVQKVSQKPGADTHKNIKRAELSTDFSNSTLAPEGASNDVESPLALPATPTSELARDLAQTPTRALGEWDCVAQGLDSSNYGRDTFGMGGSQDSAYEYFSKVKPQPCKSIIASVNNFNSNIYFLAVLRTSIVPCISTP